MFPIHPIGHVRTPYTDRSNAPKRPDYEGDECTIKIDETYVEGLKDVDGFSYLYLLCFLDRIESYHLTAYPPQDGRPHGVFATRSPFRPNPISLTRVKLVRREGTTLTVTGLDLLDNTPVIDIKPYTGRIPDDEDIRFGWLDELDS